jgi:dipeptidyl aminopeptidase/acylaminoacyl peptidase
MDFPSAIRWYASEFLEPASRFCRRRPATSSWVARCRRVAAWSALGAAAGLAAAPSATAQSTIPDPVLAPTPALSATLPGTPGEQVITPDWLLHHAADRSGGVARLFWLADNRRVVYERRPAPGATPRLEVVDAETGKTDVLGEGMGAVLSPDGRTLAFARTVHDTTQIWVMRVDRTGLRQITTIRGGVVANVGYGFSLAWSPDGRRLAVAFRPADRILMQLAERLDALAADTGGTSAWEVGSSRTFPADGQLWVYDLTTGDAGRVVSVPYQLRDITWFPDGREILFTVNRIWDEYGDQRNVGEIWAVGAGNGKLRKIAAPPGLQQSLEPALSPDGSRVVFSYDPDSPVYAMINNVGVAPARTVYGDTTVAPPPPRRLTRDGRFSPVEWAPDGRRVYSIRTYGAYDQLWWIDPATGAMTQLTDAPFSVSSFGMSRDGRRLAWAGNDAYGRVALYVGDRDARRAREVVTPVPAPAGVHLSEVREITWSTRDGLRIRGLFIPPLGRDPASRAPLIVDIHGGGWASRMGLMGSVLMTTPLEWQMWAAKGYAVLLPDYRVTGTYGWSSIAGLAAWPSYLDANMEDIVGGVDSLIRAGVVDSTRMAIVGHSAGAIQANWAAVRTHQFRAIVSYEGIADEYFAVNSGRNVVSAGNPNLRAQFGGWPWEVPDRYLRSSAVFHARGATTPTLFLMGSPAHGGIDHNESVQVLYSELKQQGVDTKYVVYPDEGHAIARPANLRDVLTRSIDWIDAHLR